MSTVESQDLSHVVRENEEVTTVVGTETAHTVVQTEVGHTVRVTYLGVTGPQGPPGPAGDIAIPFIIDGGGDDITTGQRGHVEIPFACDINRASVAADQVGSIIIDIWKAPFVDFPPTVGDSIVGGEPPALLNQQTSQDDLLVGWTTHIDAGDWLAFNVPVASGVKRVTLSLRATRESL